MLQNDEVINFLIYHTYNICVPQQIYCNAGVKSEYNCKEKQTNPLAEKTSSLPSESLEIQADKWAVRMQWIWAAPCINQQLIGSCGILIPKQNTHSFDMEHTWKKSRNHTKISGHNEIELK